MKLPFWSFSIDCGKLLVVQPLVSCLTPTLDREERHADLYRVFSSQTYENRELVVLDESTKPSRFFTALRDDSVRYFHEPSARGAVTRIGAARNRLMELSRGAIACHLDDDDHYDPRWIETMAERLIRDGVALLKLVVWRCIQGDAVYEWDTRKMGGKHYALKGGEPPVETTVDDSGEVGERIRDAYELGFGFSYCFPRSTWERFKFPEEGTEDIPWARAIRAAGGKIGLVSDLAEMVLHTVHEKSQSVLFPQRRIAGAPEDAWVELPRGESVVVRPGTHYRVLACVKESHNLKSLTVRAASWGVAVTSAQDRVPGVSWGVATCPAGYRLVLLEAHASGNGTMPWSVPSPLSVFDKTHLERAWTRLERAYERRVAGLPPRVVAVRHRRAR